MFTSRCHRSLILAGGVCWLLAGAGLNAQSNGPAAFQREMLPESAGSPTAAWIWRTSSPGEEEKLFFRREFQLPPNVAAATITLVCDDWHQLFVNGVDLGMGDDWQAPVTHNLLPHLKPGGKNLIAVEARNHGGAAGLAVRLGITLKDGKRLTIVTDGSWQCAAETEDGWRNEEFPAAAAWPRAVVIAKMGDAPWGALMPASTADAGVAKDMTADYKVASGFKLERIYQIPADQGSWVAVTADDRGHLFCADQYGKIYRVTPATDPQSVTTVELTNLPLQGAHGLLWHQGVLWITVNEGTDASGIWRAADLDGDGEFEPPTLVQAMDGRGEHGPHGMVAAPDGKSIYVTVGNFTKVVETASSLVSRQWAEDQLLPRRPDARGHARDRMAPGGWIGRFTTDGKNFQLFASGFRNAYDLAFNARGDLFTYDSDMEWDLGSPWYRPTRICHVVPGAEFGWRNGSGPWPPYYEDSMPPVLEIGPGSPTGLAAGTGAKFPAKYQAAVFAMDWTFATLYAIHLTPEGGGYRAEREEFISGTGLPLTDLAVGTDGAMYFLTGGRRTGSALWRVTYTGSESTSPLSSPPPLTGNLASGIQQDRELLQAVATSQPTADFSPEKIALLWAQLGASDRLQRYSARLVLEQIPAASWASRLDGETQPWRIITAALALARTGTPDHAAAALAALDRLAWSQLDAPQQLNWLRAAGLVFARGGPPDAAASQRVIAKIDSSFPATEDFLNRELCRMLSYLQAPGIVARTLTLMDHAGPSPAPDWLELASRNGQYGKSITAMIENLPPAQVIHYVYCLRVVQGPWHRDERSRFFSWLAKLATHSGGESYSGFITDLRLQTLTTCTPEEREWIEKLPTTAPPNPFANLPEIQGPGREWSVEEVVKLAATGLTGRDKTRGQDIYRASLCAACHRIGGQGGAAGPDLSSLAGRFGVQDLAEAILAPSRVISDQFAADLITRQDGTQLMGKIIEEKDGKWLIATNPFDPTQITEIEQNAIKEHQQSPISPMPPGLINRLNPDELKDLLAYLLNP